MQALFYSQARNNLREIINRVCDDFDEYIITTKDAKTSESELYFLLFQV